MQVLLEDSFTITIYKGFKPYSSNTNTACQRLHFTFGRSLLVRATRPLRCNFASYTCSLLHCDPFSWYALSHRKCGVFLYMGKPLFQSQIDIRRLPTSPIISSFILYYAHHMAFHSAHRIDC